MRFDYTRSYTFPFSTQRGYAEILNGNLGYITGNDSFFSFPPRPMPSDRWAAVKSATDSSIPNSSCAT